MAQAQGQDFFGWYHEIPLISKLYLTSAVGITTACFLDLVSPLTLYYNYELVLNKGQYWRIITSFLFFGSFSIDFLFHMYFVVRYCRNLEEGPFRGRTADFVFMIFYGALMMLICSMTIDFFSKIKFLGHPLTFMMVYLWSRDPEVAHMRMNFFGVITFNGPYLPWVLLLFSLVLGNPIEMDLMGILVGHTYYFLDTVYPQVAAVRGWSLTRIMVTPSILHYVFSTDPGFQIIDTGILDHIHNQRLAAAGGNPAPAGAAGAAAPPAVGGAVAAGGGNNAAAPGPAQAPAPAAAAMAAAGGNGIHPHMD